MSKIITHEEFLNQVNEKNQYIKIIGKYTRKKDKVDCQCLICNEFIRMAPESILRGSIHSACRSKINADKRRKSTETFINELNQISPHVEVLGNYTGARNNIMCKCLKHNEVFQGVPTHLLQGKVGCEKCFSEKMNMSLAKSQMKFIEEAKISNPNINILGKYVSSKQKIQVECAECGFIWTPQAGSILQGYGCPKCVGRHKTTEEFKNEIYQINPNIDIIGNYVDSREKILCRCKKCQNEWLANPCNLRYTGCPICRESHGEREIRQYLVSHQITFTTQKKFDDLRGIGGRNLSYDFYIEKYNILIEFQGAYHDNTANNQTDEEFAIRIEHDDRKRNYAKIHNINLLEIWYWDFKNINQILERNLC